MPSRRGAGDASHTRHLRAIRIAYTHAGHQIRRVAEGQIVLEVDRDAGLARHGSIRQAEVFVDGLPECRQFGSGIRWVSA